ncbi:MAG: hypothetical protein LBK76_11790 [Verrucomicrobiales bacterium]|jgi:hypothetical protein|nr:hypothetical protein [Verrucomicrobiales bacterium]
MAITVIEKIQELEKLKSTAAKLSAAIETERTRELATLPAKYGYTDLNDFIKALKDAANTRAARKPRAVKPNKKAKGKYVRVTPELKEQVAAAVRAGQSAAAIKASLGLSVASIHKIKTALGLVKPRGAQFGAAVV